MGKWFVSCELNDNTNQEQISKYWYSHLTIQYNDHDDPPQNQPSMDSTALSDGSWERIVGTDFD